MNIKDIAIHIVALLLIATCFLIVYHVSYRAGYEACAKDVYKGKMKVDLVENADGTKEWKWIK